MPQSNHILGNKDEFVFVHIHTKYSFEFPLDTITSGVLRTASAGLFFIYVNTIFVYKFCQKLNKNVICHNYQV